MYYTLMVIIYYRSGTMPCESLQRRPQASMAVFMVSRRLVSLIPDLCVVS